MLNCWFRLKLKTKSAVLTISAVEESVKKKQKIVESKIWLKSKINKMFQKSVFKKDKKITGSFELFQIYFQFRVSKQNLIGSQANCFVF